MELVGYACYEHFYRNMQDVQFVEIASTNHRPQNRTATAAYVTWALERFYCMYTYMPYKPLYEYNKARSSLLLPALASTLVIDCRSLSTSITATLVIDCRSLSISITATSVLPGGATRLCTRWCPSHSPYHKYTYI